jgi:hypothetical protein
MTFRKKAKGKEKKVKKIPQAGLGANRYCGDEKSRVFYKNDRDEYRLRPV